MSAGRFWATSLVVAVGFAVLCILAFPYDAIGADTAPERHRALLLTLWTAGVMAICFGGAGLVGSITPIGIRDVAEVGSVTAAVEARRSARMRDTARFYNFAGWIVATGLWVILIYFGAWLSMR